MSPRPSEPARLVVCDEDGQIFDHPELLAAGVRGPSAERLPPDELIPLPEGSDLFMLPARAPRAVDPATGRIVTLDEPGLVGCAAFLAPAWTRSDVPAYETRPDGPVLPTYAYAAVAFADGRFWTTGARVDPDVRQDPWTFDLDLIRSNAFGVLERHAENRVMQQVSRCALEYGCRAAQNFFLFRHEAPLPCSVACNAQCVGCISLQPDGEFRASHERLTRRVTPDELCDVAVEHWRNVPDGVVSFGQGCEGEPLLEAEVLVEAVRLMKKRNPRGTVNLNSNASRPDAVAELAEAGLDSMRVSLNSPRPELYEAYYRPRQYGVADVEQSIREMKRRGRWVSVNLLHFPGVTDTRDEIDAIVELLGGTGVDLVQLRNLNIDPELYRDRLPRGAVAPGCGVPSFLDELRERLPRLRFGYFNPTKARYAELAG